ncbi:protein kinase, putative [Bodo saltans]|uniref:Protein kinase, putative n=1 Tax=Bodo saltans TaxID=75058 RepID=A0A0S4J343_BODSA|nr:protein kinase, putative [Bodo saltans]|eukprot:CUG85687.1 protein kinase, putative [Bodo saltans]
MFEEEWHLHQHQQQEIESAAGASPSQTTETIVPRPAASEVAATAQTAAPAVDEDLGVGAVTVNSDTLAVGIGSVASLRASAMSTKDDQPSTPTQKPAATGRSRDEDGNNPPPSGRQNSVDQNDVREDSSSPTHGKYGIVSGPGSEDQLWELAEDNVAPRFPYGAGFSLEVLHASVDMNADVAHVVTSPYLKEPPPTGLPLESFELKVIYEAGRTGFEEAKDFPIVPNTVIAGRYQILQYLDSAAFSRAVKCLDLKHKHEVCIKIIRNSKDFFDQSLDEIKLLQWINAQGNADDHCVLQLYDFFYFKEHIFIVCELLRDNLYEFSKYNREQEAEFYFTLARVQHIARQVLTGLAFIHDMNLMHCDLKPENILIKSYSRCEIRVIDFGSSCFTTDNLSSYIQSRCYRAPEVVLGCHYDGRIDVWSVGCILPELLTGTVMFHNKTVSGMLARIAGVCGPFPERMLHEGRHSCRFVTKHGVFYETKESTGEIEYHFPATSSLDQLDLGSNDPLFRDFIRKALTVDHTLRPTAKELLDHPFLKHDYGAVYSPPPAKKSKGGSASPI